MFKRKKYLFGAIFILDVILFSFISYSYLSGRVHNKSKTQQQSSTEPTSALTANEVSKGSTVNFLLMGYGGAGHDGGNLTDVIMLASINQERKQVTFVSIPRDLWVEVPVRSDLRQNYKANAAYAIGSDDKKYPLKEPQYKGAGGGATMAKKVIGETVGLNIKGYAAIDFESFKKLVDALKGIEVDVPVTFDDYHYPIKGNENETCGLSATQIAEFHQKYSGDELNYQFPCRYEHLHFDKGIQKIDGDSALKFVRSRHSAQDGGDFARSRRQKAVILGVRDKLISIDAVKNIDDVYKELSSLMKTDLSLSDLKVLLKALGEPRDYKTKFVGLNEDNVLMSTKSLDGQFILMPKEGENVWSNVQAFIYKEITAP